MFFFFIMLLFIMCKRFLSEKFTVLLNCLYKSFLGKSYDNILVETAGEKNNVGLIRLNRPKALNALCNALFDDLEHALNDMEKNPEIGCIILTGSEKAFAAGLCRFKQ